MTKSERSLFVKENTSVRYVHNVDSDPEEVPNISPAIVVKVKPNGNLNLFVMTSSGTFHANDVPRGGAKERGTWHRFQIIE